MLKKATPTTPARRTSADLAAIPRRTPQWVHVNADPEAGTLDKDGKEKGPRVGWTNRAARRAWGQARGMRRTPAARFVPYMKNTAA